MAIIVQPKTQAELNQLVSILHSTGRCINNPCDYARIGGVYHLWHSAFLNCELMRKECVGITNVHVQVNQLVDYLNKH